MKIQDIVISNDYHFKKIECNVLSKEQLNTVPNLTGEVVIQSNNMLCFETKNEFFTFKIKNQENEMLIYEKLNKKYVSIAYSEDVVTNDSFFLDIKFFPRVVSFGTLNILLTEEISEILNQRHYLSKQEIKDANFSSFTSEFMIKSNYEEYFLCGLGYDEDDEDKAAFLDKTLKDIFLYGPSLSISISIEDNMAVVKRVTPSKPKNIKTVLLGRGKIAFVKEKLYISEKVTKLLEENNEYLKIWDEYSNLEGDFLLAQARKVGAFVMHKKSTFVNSKIEIYVIECESLKNLSVGDQLCFVSKLPSYLENDDVSWLDYRKERLVQEKEDVASYKNRAPSYKILKIDVQNSTIILDTIDDSIVDYSYAILDILGNEMQILRREKAKLNISSGNCAMQTLGLILEGSAEALNLNSNNKRKKINPLSVHVKEKIFKNEPTDTQKKAIEIALNTPDIAIIQGPPGTGKTTVITAVIERLNEMFDKRESIKGQILVTSFQHDAVENVIERLRINSLPTLKFGKRNGVNEAEFTERLIENWCNETIDKIKEKNIQIEEVEYLENFHKSYKFYKSYPTHENEKAFLETAKIIALDEEVKEEIDNMLEAFELQEKVQKNDIYKDVLKLRVKLNSFVDDGKENIVNLYNSLEHILMNSSTKNQEILKKLQLFYSYGDNVTKEQLTELEKIRTYLLKMLKPKPAYKIEKENLEINAIYEKLKHNKQKPKNQIDELLLEFLNELETNQEKVKTALNDYSFVFASSIQQAAGQEISKAKNKNQKESVIYDTVIVDEAARANPGDLLIPLTQAKNRIILVGDQRQLPHIYSNEIVEKLMEDGDNFDLNNIKISMFEKLMEIGQKLQSNDGIQRTITLDAQYRMHPLLGNFVCKNFYKNPSEFFDSPLPEELFKQNIMKSPANWIDVDVTKGFEKNINKSRSRPAEVDVIIYKIEEILSNPESADLSIGVISFYSAQVKDIKKRLSTLSSDIADKIRVGSVDAFQGMEFDIIFLSTVRTSANLDNIDVENMNEKLAIKTFGFMQVENRLCVAMSRQKKILIAVGDAKLFKSELAKRYVPALKNYYDLCHDNGGVINV